MSNSSSPTENDRRSSRDSPDPVTDIFSPSHARLLEKLQELKLREILQFAQEEKKKITFAEVAARQMRELMKKKEEEEAELREQMYARTVEQQRKQKKKEQEELLRYKIESEQAYQRLMERERIAVQEQMERMKDHQKKHQINVARKLHEQQKTQKIREQFEERYQQKASQLGEKWAKAIDVSLDLNHAKIMEMRRKRMVEKSKFDKVEQMRQVLLQNVHEKKEEIMRRREELNNRTEDHLKKRHEDYEERLMKSKEKEAKWEGKRKAIKDMTAEEIEKQFHQLRAKEEEKLRLAQQRVMEKKMEVDSKLQAHQQKMNAINQKLQEEADQREKNRREWLAKQEQESMERKVDKGEMKAYMLKHFNMFRDAVKDIKWKMQITNNYDEPDITDVSRRKVDMHHVDEHASLQLKALLTQRTQPFKPRGLLRHSVNEEEEIAQRLKKRKKTKLRVCGLCEHHFPADTLPGLVSRHAALQMRETLSKMVNDEESLQTAAKPAALGTLYDEAPICSFCYQFFQSEVDKAHSNSPLVSTSSLSSAHPNAPAATPPLRFDDILRDDEEEFNFNY